MTNDPRTNWAGNVAYTAAGLRQPASVEELQQLVVELPRIKALGARHSFNSIADTAGQQISLSGFRQMTLNQKANAVTVGAGVTYGELAPWLNERGFALHNLASLPHLSVAGACATGTHGSGVRNRCLSAVVNAIEFVNGLGELIQLSREDEDFRGAVVGLGALGIVTQLILDVEPAFQMEQHVYENLSFDQLEDNLFAIFASAYSVSLFTDWQQHRATQVWLKRRISAAESGPPPAYFYGATLQTAKLHPLQGHSPENCTEQMGIEGPWHERLPHFRTDFTPSSGAELQTEYFVPVENAYGAILAVERLRDRITPHLFVTEMRMIAADDLWMSMAQGRDSFALHFTWKPEWDAVKAVLPLIEAELEPFGARPHWAKLYTTTLARLCELYPRFADFQRLVSRHDPQGKFRNEYLQHAVGL